MTRRPLSAATAIAALFAAGGACAGEPAFVATATIPVPEATVDPVVSTATSPPATSQPVDVASGPVASGAFEPAERGARVAVGLPPTVPTTVAQPIDGQCDTWRPLLERYGLPWDEFEAIIWRESNCSHAIADRPSTGDLSAGILQANFYGYLNDMWESAGWSWGMVRDDPEVAVAAAGALYRMCGGLGPWTPPYSCGGNVLPTPTEMGYLP